MTDLVNEVGKWLYRALPGIATPETKETIVREIREVVMPPTATGRLFVRVAGLSGALAVGLAAYGAHALKVKDEETEHRQAVFASGQKMHMFHTMALFCTPLARKPYLAGSLFTLGTLLFSGGCYYIALTGDDRYKRLNPIGGMCLIFGWLSVIL